MSRESATISVKYHNGCTWMECAGAKRALRDTRAAHGGATARLRPLVLASAGWTAASRRAVDAWNTQPALLASQDMWHPPASGRRRLVTSRRGSPPRSGGCHVPFSRSEEAVRAEPLDRRQRGPQGRSGLTRAARCRAPAAPPACRATRRRRRRRSARRTSQHARYALSEPTGADLGRRTSGPAPRPSRPSAQARSSQRTCRSRSPPKPQ